MSKRYAVQGPCGPGARDRKETLGYFASVEEAEVFISGEIIDSQGWDDILQRDYYAIVDTGAE